VAAVATCLAGCGARGTTAAPSSGSVPSPITVTTAASCRTGTGPATITWFPLGSEDNGRSYRMVPCQAVGVELLHSAPDGCGWNSVQTTDSAVVAILPIPLPLPPQGATFEVFGAVAAGRATLRSSLSCPDGSVEQSWSVTIEVAVAATASP
jgi:hypothetical protein